MQMLKIGALLMEYPEIALWEEREELCALVAQRAPMLQGFVDGWLGGALLDRQSEWCETFAAAPPRCCCLNMCMASRAIAARRWSI